MKRHTTVYGLRVIGSDEVRYVGQTIRPLATRLYSHVYLAHKGSELPVCRWIRKHDGLVEIIVLKTKARWCIDEIAIIKKLRRAGVKLLNVTDGGDGVQGYTHSSETRAKMSEAQKKLPKRTRSQKTRDRIAASLAGRTKSQEHKDRIAEGLRGRPQTAEHVAAKLAGKLKRQT